MAALPTMASAQGGDGSGLVVAVISRLGTLKPTENHRCRCSNGRHFRTRFSGSTACKVYFPGRPVGVLPPSSCGVRNPGYFDEEGLFCASSGVRGAAHSVIEITGILPSELYRFHLAFCCRCVSCNCFVSNKTPSFIRRIAISRESALDTRQEKKGNFGHIFKLIKENGVSCSTAIVI